MDRLKYAILTEGHMSVKNYISKVFGCNDLAELSPGSLPDWPVNSNNVLFDLLGQGDEIGVILKEDGFMAPLNSVSGILYTGYKDFVNCSLCKKLDCIGRKDLFNEAEYKRIFQI
ncbi:hypothetical protein [Eubacterium aggregans]|uniref:hypothetical protein n=1 Tax=Eubacterium aggregans TaxID=81409 RepID=UPI003F2BCB76